MINSQAALGNKLDSFPELSVGEMHVWHVSTNVTPEAFLEYKNVLTEKEAARIPFFKFKQVKDTFVASQGALRILISRYIGISPDLVRLGRRKKGKPYSIDNPNLNFNLSNSGKTVVIAFSYDSEIGIDIEQIRHLPDLDELIKKNFTTREIKFITANAEHKERRFFRFWTIKESYLKAIGEGMRLTPDKLEFAIENGSTSLLSVKGVFEQEDWNFKEFSTSTDYVGTITYGRDNTAIRIMEFK